MLRVEIKDAAVHTEMIRPSGKPGAKVFDPFEKRYQIGYVFLTDQNGTPQPYPAQFYVPLQKDQEAYPVGNYSIGPESFYVDRNRNLILGRTVLRAVSGLGVKAA